MEHIKNIPKAGDAQLPESFFQNTAAAVNEFITQRQGVQAGTLDGNPMRQQGFLILEGTLEEGLSAATDAADGFTTAKMRVYQGFGANWAEANQITVTNRSTSVSGEQGDYIMVSLLPNGEWRPLSGIEDSSAVLCGYEVRARCNGTIIENCTYYTCRKKSDHSLASRELVECDTDSSSGSETSSPSDNIVVSFCPNTLPQTLYAEIVEFTGASGVAQAGIALSWDGDDRWTGSYDPGGGNPVIEIEYIDIGNGYVNGSVSPSGCAPIGRINDPIQSCDPLIHVMGYYGPWSGCFVDDATSLELTITETP